MNAPLLDEDTIIRIIVPMFAEHRIMWLKQGHEGWFHCDCALGQALRTLVNADTRLTYLAEHVTVGF